MIELTWLIYPEKTMTVKEGQIVTVTDPCYDADTPSAYLHLPAGEYNCYYDIIDEGSWGMRIAHCALLKKGASDYFLDEGFTEYAGSTGVDAGLAGFFIDKPDYDDKAWDEFCANLRKADAEWKEISGRSYKEVYHIPEGFFTCSGYGDGEYAVYLLKGFKDDVIGAKLVFIEDEYDEDEEDEEEYEDEDEDY